MDRDQQKNMNWLIDRSIDMIYISSYHWTISVIECWYDFISNNQIRAYGIIET